MTIKEAIQLLELSAPFSKAALKKAYRDALMVWHPDRFTGNTELKAKAENRTYQINEAYALLSRIPESDYPYRASVECQQAKQPPSSNPQRANAGPPSRPKPEPTRTQSSSPPQRTGGPTQPPIREPFKNQVPFSVPSGWSFKRLDSLLNSPRAIRVYSTMAWIMVTPFVVWLLVSTLIRWNRESDQRSAANIYTAPRNLPFQASASGTSVEDRPVDLPSLSSLSQLQVNAEQGDKEAQYQLGNAYINGDGVAKDPKEAVKWFQLAADQGHAEAQFNLGVSYANGEGVNEDAEEAVKWFRKAAEQGEADGQQKLGACYEKGIGVAKDAVEAAKWYHMAASQGHARAQFDFGFCCKLGEGVIKNSVLGHMWLNLANAQGEKAAKNALSMLEAEMTPAQIAEAENLAANFRPTKDESQNDTPQSVNSASKIVSPSAGPSVQEEMSDDEKDRQFQIMVEAWEAEAGRAFPDANIAGSALSLAIEQQLNVIKRTDPEYLLRSPDAGYKLVAAEAAKLGIAPLSHPSKSFLSALPTAKDIAGTLELRHLPSDERLTSGSILTDRLTPLGGKGKLSLDNGLTEDAFVKMISNDRLVASFYVRGGEKFTFTHVPDGVYRLIYCTGFGWEAARRDFERGRHAMRYDEALDFTTTRRTEGNSIITSTGVMTLTLHKVANGNARTSGIPLEEFDRY